MWCIRGRLANLIRFVSIGFNFESICLFDKECGDIEELKTAVRTFSVQDDKIMRLFRNAVTRLDVTLQDIWRTAPSPDISFRTQFARCIRSYTGDASKFVVFLISFSRLVVPFAEVLQWIGIPMSACDYKLGILAFIINVK